MTVDNSSLGTLVIMALSNVGAVAVIGKWLVKSVEKTNESLPLIMNTLETQNQAIKELFESRNSHSDDITIIKTTHKINGCDQPPGERPHRRASDKKGD